MTHELPCSACGKPAYVLSPKRPASNAGVQCKQCRSEERERDMAQLRQISRDAPSVQSPAIRRALAAANKITKRRS